MEKYNCARADFEQKMLDSALVRTGVSALETSLSWGPGCFGSQKSRASHTLDSQEAQNHKHKALKF